MRRDRFRQTDRILLTLIAVASLAARHAELVNLYKTLGGGWVDAADPLAPRPEPVVPPSEADLPESGATG